MKPRIFVAEDDESINREVARLLGRNGYETIVPRGWDDLARQVIDATCDLVLLDLSLPEEDGLRVCRRIRQKSSVPIIILTSRNDEANELMGMNLGADDFVAKPYRPQILLAHIASVLRRVVGGMEDLDTNTIEYRGVRLDRLRATVSYGESRCELSRNELRILDMLMSNVGTPVSRQEIQNELWQSDDYVDDNTLSVNVTRIRRNLETIGVEDFLHTRRGLGYQVS
jgi:DNA-binding response OmpR family regulator